MALILTPTLTLTLALALALTFLALTLTLTLARHYAMARVMPLLLTMKRWKVPDLDAVFSGTDYPIMEIPRDAAHMQRMCGPADPPPCPASSRTAYSRTAYSLQPTAHSLQPHLPR